MGNENKVGISWLVIVLSLIFCWPVALVLAVLKFNSYSFPVSKGHTDIIAGYLIVALSGLMFILSMGNRFWDADATVVCMLICIVSCILGVFLIRRGRGAIRQAERIKKYIDLIVNQQCGSIDNIASLLGRSDIESVLSEVKELIDSEILNGYRLDETTRIIEKIETGMESKNEPLSGPTYSFVCKACGATNEVAADAERQCEFCETMQ